MVSKETWKENKKTHERIRVVGKVQVCAVFGLLDDKYTNGTRRVAMLDAGVACW